MNEDDRGITNPYHVLPSTGPTPWAPATWPISSPYDNTKKRNDERIRKEFDEMLRKHKHEVNSATTVPQEKHLTHDEILGYILTVINDVKSGKSFEDAIRDLNDPKLTEALIRTLALMKLTGEERKAIGHG